MNLKKTIKQSILQYMEDSDIDVDEIEDIELTSYEMKRAIKEESVEVYFRPDWSRPIELAMVAGYNGIKLNGKVIKVREKPE